MDFSFSDEQDAVAGVATQIFTGQASTERVKEVERSDGPDALDDSGVVADVLKFLGAL